MREPLHYGRETRAWDGFAKTVDGDKPLELIRAALWVAAAEYPDLDVNREIARLQFLGHEATSRVEQLSNPFARLDGLRDFIYDDLGFRGNARNYQDPRNSFLNDVLNRRLGIPLTLSMLFCELAAAAGFETRGVGLPGHFVARLDWDGRTLFVDPFHGGRVITQEDCAELVAQSTGRPNLFKRSLLDGIDDEGILTRLLHNLKRSFIRAEDYPRALGIVRRLLLLHPDDTRELRDRGFLLAHLGRPGAAIADLEAYLETAKEPSDATAVRARLVWLQRRLSEMN